MGAGTECERIRRLVQEYLDGELDDPTISAIIVHIEVCKPCGRRVVFEAAFHRTISRGRTEDAPSSVLQERCATLISAWKRDSHPGN